MKPVIFFDLDGVLADFVGGALALHGKELPRDEVQWDFYSQIGFDGPSDPRFWGPMGHEFWAGLSVLPDGLCLLRTAERLVGAENIAFLSSPCETAGCADGKRAWVRRHFPDYARRLFLGSAKHLFAGPGKILVDDHDKNTGAFGGAGGLYVLVPRPWNVNRTECHPGGSFDVPQVARWLEGTLSLANPKAPAKAA
jgi:hypothetical protein